MASDERCIPQKKRGPICVIEGYDLYHVITVGDCIVKVPIILHIHPKIMKYHDLSTKLDVDHRTINIFDDLFLKVL